MACIPWDKHLQLLQKEAKQLPSTQAFPPTKNPPWRRKKSGWGEANAKHSGSGEATFPVSHPHCLSCKAKSDDFPHTLTPALASLLHQDLVCDLQEMCDS